MARNRGGEEEFEEGQAIGLQENDKIMKNNYYIVFRRNGKSRDWKRIFR